MYVQPPFMPFLPNTTGNAKVPGSIEILSVEDPTIKNGKPNMDSMVAHSLTQMAQHPLGHVSGRLAPTGAVAAGGIEQMQVVIQ